MHTPMWVFLGIKALEVLCVDQKHFFELHQDAKCAIVILTCPLTHLWAAGVERTVVLSSSAKLFLEPCCAESCQDTEQLWGELRGLDGSYTQCFGEVINSWPSIYFCKALVKQP